MHPSLIHLHAPLCKDVTLIEIVHYFISSWHISNYLQCLYNKLDYNEINAHYLHFDPKRSPKHTERPQSINKTALYPCAKDPSSPLTDFLSKCHHRKRHGGTTFKLHVDYLSIRNQLVFIVQTQQISSWSMSLSVTKHENLINQCRFSILSNRSISVDKP